MFIPSVAAHQGVISLSVAGEDGLSLFEGQLYPVFSAMLRKARLPIKINMSGPG